MTSLCTIRRRWTERDDDAGQRVAGVFENNIPKVIRKLCLSINNFCYSAHLLDLLHHLGAGLTDRDDGVGPGLTEMLRSFGSFCSWTIHNNFRSRTVRSKPKTTEMNNIVTLEKFYSLISEAWTLKIFVIHCTSIPSTFLFECAEESLSCSFIFI